MAVLYIKDQNGVFKAVPTIKGDRGMSAYEHYLATTTDNPVLTEQEYADAASEANNAAQSATNLVNSYATDLAAKELKANKQNSLAVDGTGTKFPTVDAVNEGLVANQNLVAEYVHTSNLEISGFTVDTATGTFTKTGHGLANGDILYVCLNANTNTLFLKDITYSEFSQTSSMIHYVIEATADTFKLSKTLGGAVTTLTPIAGTDITKWHFEKRTTGGPYDTLTISNLSSLTANVKNIKVVIAGSIKSNDAGGHLYFNINTPVVDTRYIYNPLSGVSAVRATYTLQRADGFGTIEYEVTRDGFKRSIKKTHIMIKDKDLTPYVENQIFYMNINSNVFNNISLYATGFANGTSVRVYKY